MLLLANPYPQQLFSNAVKAPNKADLNPVRIVWTNRPVTFRSGIQAWMCPHYLTSARCPCTALTKRVPRLLPSSPQRLGSDGNSGADEDDNTTDDEDQFHLILIRADDTERHAAYHIVDRLTALLSYLAEDIESEIVRSGAPSRILEADNWVGDLCATSCDLFGLYERGFSDRIWVSEQDKGQI